MDNIKNPKGAGRKRNFNTEKLLSIIDSYILEENMNNISASKIAKYAKDKLKIEGIMYYHFTKDDVVKRKLDELQSSNNKQYISDGILAFQNIDINSFVDKSISNPMALKKKLLDLQIGQESIYKKMVKLETDNRELKLALKDKFIKIEQTNFTELKKENQELKDSMKLLQSLIDVDNHIKMCKFVWDNSLIEPNDMADQYIALLLKCGVIKDTDVEDIKSNSDVVDIAEISKEAIDLFEKTKITSAETDEKLKSASVDDLITLLND